VPCSSVANIGESKTWTQSEFCTWQNSVRGARAPKMYTQNAGPIDGQTLCKVWLISVERRRCSNEAKMRNPLEFAAWVPQTRQPISAVTAQNSSCHEDMWRKYCCLTSFFPIVDKCVSWEDIARQSCAVVHRQQFLRHFCVLHFQRAACSTFQTCILNSQ